MVNLTEGNLQVVKRPLEILYKGCLISVSSSALMGDFQEIQTINRQSTGFDAGIYAFTRWSDTPKLIVVTNFSGRY
jgi:hypothetical protein